MTNKQLHELTMHKAIEGLQAGNFTSVALTQAVLDRIDAVESDVRSYITLLGEQALAQAAQADEQRQQGHDGPLLGVPLAIKDV